MPPTVRPASSADAALIVEFNQRLAHETEDKHLDADTLAAGVEAVLRDPQRGRYLVAEIDGVVAGQLMLTREWSEWRNGWFWWIQSVYVRADARRAGVFRALLERVLSESAAERDVVGVRLYVENENHRAQQVYQVFGFAQTDYLLLERMAR